MLKKFLLVLIPIIILAGITGGIGYNKLFRQKVEGVQDVNSKIINRPKESENIKKSSPNASNTSSTQQKSENKSSSNTEQPSYQIPNTNFNNNSYLSDLGNILSIPSLPTPAHNDAYWDSLIKQAEEEAQRSHEALQNAEECFKFQQEKDATFFPLKQAINDLWIQYYNAEDIVNERTKGTDVNESQRLRMVEAEKQKIKSQIDQFQAEYNRLYSEYGSC